VLPSRDFFKVYLFFRKHGIWVVLGKILVSLLSLILSVVLTRLMSTQEYGSYQYYLSVFLLLGSFSIPGATSSIIKYVALGYDWTYKSLFKLRFKYSTLASIIFIALSLYNIYLNNIVEASIYFIFAFIFPFYHSYDLFAYFLHAKIELKRLNTLYIVRSSLQVLATIVAYFISKSVEVTLITFIMSIALINTVLYYKIFPKSSIKMHDISISNQANKMAIGLSLVGILSIVVGQIDKVLVFNLIRPESLAIFSIGMMIGITVNSLFKSILSSFSAKLVTYNIKKWHYATVFITGTITGAMISMTAPYLIEIVYGDVYKESAYYASVVFCSLGVYLVNSLFYDSNMLNHKKNIKSIYMSEIGVSAIQLIVILALFFYISSGEEILLYLPFVYTLKVSLSILFIYISNYNRKVLDV
jgi:O-antigen/teichoic acid export membrane protein